MKSYLKMDFYRMLTSKYFGIGILGVVGVYGLSLMQLKSQDVYLLNYYIKFYSTYMLLLIFGAIAYSNAMMEDLEYKNFYLQIQKGSFRKYIWSKVITAFISAVIVMVLGTSIFCLMAHFKMPLLSPDNDMLEYLAEGDYLNQLITPETIFDLPNLRIAYNGKNTQDNYYGFFLRSGKDFYLLDVYTDTLYQTNLELSQDESIRNAISDGNDICISIMDERDTETFTTKNTIIVDFDKLKKSISVLTS